MSKQDHHPAGTAPELNEQRKGLKDRLKNCNKSLEDYKEFINVLQFLVLLIGVPLLWWEAREVQKQQVADSLQMFFDSPMSINRAMLDNKLWAAMDLHQYEVLGFMFLGHFDKVYLLHKKGVVDDDLFAEQKQLLFNQAKHPIIRCLWNKKGTSDGYRQQFRDDLTAEIANLDNSDCETYWKGLEKSTQEQ